MLEIVKMRPPVDLREAYVLAMYLLWASRPSKRDCERDGSYFIGDVGEAPKKNWTKMTPYSPARRVTE
jgi:hypothetical protein